MELKLYSSKFSFSNVNCSNRTFMELKLVRLLGSDGSIPLF